MGRRCSRCKNVFTVKEGDKGNYMCKPCRTNYTRHRDRPWQRSAQLKYLYGITVGEYNEYLEAQKGVCGICGKEETGLRNGKGKNLAVDHNHTTSMVRGLLCENCNTTIGRFEDNPELLRKAADWIENDGVWL